MIVIPEKQTLNRDLNSQLSCVGVETNTTPSTKSLVVRDLEQKQVINRQSPISHNVTSA